MLAQNFMTATDLGITEEQHAALVKTLAFFERGEVGDRFNMNNWTGSADIVEGAACGSACCVGGWAERLGALRAGELDAPLDSPRGRLFFPRDDYALTCTDPAKGAAALRNYLTTGEARWDEVMAEASS